MKKINKIAMILISNENDADASHPRKLLVARPKGKALSYILGRKWDEDESDHETLCREIDEELDVSAIIDTIGHTNVFEALTDNEEDTIVH